MSSNIINYVRPVQGQNRKDINRLLEAVSDFTAPQVEEEGFQQRITVTPHYKIRDTDVRFGGIDWAIPEKRDKATRIWRRKVTNSPNTYPLVHGLNGAGSLSFPVQDTYYGARCDFDGNMSITINDDVILNPSDKVTVAMTIRPSSVTGVQVLAMKTNSYRLRLNSATLEWNIWNTTVNTPLTKTVAINTKYTIVATYDSTNGAKLWVNNVLEDSDNTDLGALNTTDTGLLTFGGNPTHGNKYASGGRMALIHIGNFEADTTWVQNYEDGILDTDGKNEITTIPMIGDESPQPEALAGLMST